jgi:hypothetical protein
VVGEEDQEDEGDHHLDVTDVQSCLKVTPYLYIALIAIPHLGDVDHST